MSPIYTCFISAQKHWSLSYENFFLTPTFFFFCLLQDHILQKLNTYHSHRHGINASPTKMKRANNHDQKFMRGTNNKVYQQMVTTCVLVVQLTLPMLKILYFTHDIQVSLFYQNTYRNCLVSWPFFFVLRKYLYIWNISNLLVQIIYVDNLMTQLKATLSYSFVYISRNLKSNNFKKIFRLK